MTRRQKRALRLARQYIENFEKWVWYSDKTDAGTLHKILEKCRDAIKSGNGTLREYEWRPTGGYAWIDVANARVVAKLVKKLLAKMPPTEITPEPTTNSRPQHDADTDYSWSERYDWYHCRGGLRQQREVKRKQRIKAQNAPRSGHNVPIMPEPDELLELELSFKERVSHRNGHGAGWIPTRKRYWKPSNNNWKQFGRRAKQWSHE